MARKRFNRNRAKTDEGTRPAISRLKAMRNILAALILFRLLHTSLTTLVPAGRSAAPRLSKAPLLRESATKAWMNMTSNNNRNCAVECVTKLFNVLSPTQVPSTSHITLVTHGGVSKLDRILLQANAWGGPVSVAIFVDRTQDLRTFLAFIEEELQKTTQTTTTNIDKISFHLLLEVAVETGYPHNKLRNLALDMATTDYVLPLDCDFITNPNAHDQLHRLIQADEDVREKLESKYLFALPPFDLLPRPGQEFATGDMLLPITTKDEVIRQVQNGTMRQFYKGTNSDTDEFHLYPQWYEGRPPGASSTAADSRHYIPTSYTFPTEPYVVAYRRGLPPYHEAFRGFGMDKISWFFRLARVENYKFAVLYDFFLTHLHHPTVPQADQDKGLARNMPVFENYKGKLLAAKKTKD